MLTFTDTEVPLQRYITAKRSQKRSVKPKNWLSLQQKKFVITSLLLVNSLILGATVSRDQASQVQAVRSVQALVAPTQVAEAVAIHPVKAPVAEVASVTTEVAQPTPTPAPTVAAASISLPTNPMVGNWDGLLQQYFGDAWMSAKKVMLCESGGNAHAIGPINPGGSRPYGLMQIMALPGRPSPDWLMVPENNISYAARIYHAQGWGPWACKYVLGL